MCAPTRSVRAIECAHPRAACVRATGTARHAKLPAMYMRIARARSERMVPHSAWAVHECCPAEPLCLFAMSNGAGHATPPPAVRHTLTSTAHPVKTTVHGLFVVSFYLVKSQLSFRVNFVDLNSPPEQQYGAYAAMLRSQGNRVGNRDPSLTGAYPVLLT